jgi:hypothetical protein
MVEIYSAPPVFYGTQYHPAPPVEIYYILLTPFFGKNRSKEIRRSGR